MTSELTYTLRPATDADADELVRLARLDSARPLGGEVLVGELDGEPRAALELVTGRVVADPFERTADLVALMRRAVEPETRRVHLPYRRVVLTGRRAPQVA